MSFQGTPRDTTIMIPSTRQRRPYRRGQRFSSSSCLLGGSACLALLVSRGDAFLAVTQSASAVRPPRSASHTLGAMTPFASYTAEPFFPQEDSPPAVHQAHDQDFRGLFPPVHRPLSELDISEAERGLWVYEQV